MLAFAGILLLCLFAPYFAPYDPLASAGEPLSAPDSAHWLGTDVAGRDVFSRLLHGGQRTLLVAAIALLIAVGPGMALGILAGYSGGIADELLVLGLDALVAIPGLLLALCVTTLLGSGSGAVALAVGLAGFPPFARVARMATRTARHEPYIEAARSLGAAHLGILYRHILPNTLPTLIGVAMVTLAWAVLNAATLNFLGLGGDPSIPEWGAMLAEGRATYRAAPWAALAPGFVLSVTLFGISLFAKRLNRDVSESDPSNRSGR